MCQMQLVVISLKSVAKVFQPCLEVNVISKFYSSLAEIKLSDWMLQVP